VLARNAAGSRRRPAKRRSGCFNEAELKRLCVETDFHSYEDTGHGFMDPDQTRYVEAATKDAWARILAFLNRHLAVS